ncbi:MAG TPA: transglutaminase domain-containing protein [Candidatus Dormibacteraeota bacterium]|nr:transglutaminase domain-containing protein [Candidatus Dormibacteraeota bacterium]
MKTSIFLLVALSVTTLCSAAQKNVREQASQLEVKGQFKEAATLLSRTLDDKSLSSSDRKQLEFERDRLARIKKDFPYTQDELFGELQKSVKGLTRDEFDKWVAEGWFDSREIDGQRQFMSASVSNLFFRHQELEPRRMPAKERAALDQAHLAAVEAIKKAALAEKRPYVLPRRFHVTMTVTAKPTAAPAGETIKAWIPFPREYPFQSGIELLSSSSPQKHLDPPDSPIRSVLLEQQAEKGRGTEFQIVYDYTRQGVYFAPEPNRVTALPSDPSLKPFLEEAPHVQFTPELRALSKQIAGDETNPCIKAKRFYDWIGDNIKYSYAIEYSTIRNISDYCRNRGYGDCGQEALLFIALCRLNGIPARWQSGWDAFPHATTIHDWCEIYLAPYGWMPVDPYMSIYAMRYATTLKREQRLELRDFFFGGQDWYRVAVNSDHSQSLNPPKRSMRSDDVDFQRGELEWGDHNIYFDQYSYSLDYKEIKLPPSE